MPSILVVERDPNYAGRINAALSAEGWRVRVVPAVEMALQAGSAEKPDLIVAGTDLPGFEVLVFSFSRTSGGPGVLGLVPESGMGGGLDGADGHLAKPFTDQQVVLAIRQALLSGQSAAPAPPSREQKLTSHDIFGDVLAEVEGDETPGFGAPAPAPAPPSRPSALGPAAPMPAAAAPVAPAPPPKPAPPPRADDEMQRRLEKTLSGVLGPEPRPRPAAPPPAPAPAPAPPSRPSAPGAAAPVRPPAPAPPPKRPESTADNVDALLSKTLSNLEMDLGRTKTGVRPPAPAAPVAPAPAPAASAPAPPPRPAPMAPPPAQPPAQPQAAQPAPVQPVAPRPVPAAPQPPPPAPLPPREETGVGRPKVVGDFDFSELEDLIRPATVAPRPAAAPPPAPAPPMLEPPRAFAPEPQPLPFPPPAPTPPRPAPAAPASVLSDVAATQRIPVFAEEAGDAPGERFGQYTLLDRIAVGGMAEVWKARMRGVEGFQKTVAIKKILPHMTDNAEFVGMFIDEAKLAAQLSHPNIVHIYDLGKIGRDYYIAMEYVEGKDLRSLLNAARRRGMGLPLGLALLIAARVASALDYAHRRRDDDNREIGLVHRDVSPQNVLLTLEGDVKLCDFGIAKAVSKASHTLVGALKGKLQYMSPEQAWGRPVDGRSDIFSLGAVLFEMITGERLFPGDSEMSVLESVRQGRTRTPRQIDPSVPAEVDEIVARAIAIDPDSRFQTAGEMKQRLEAALAALKPSPGPTDLAAFIQRAVEPEPEPVEPVASPYMAAAPAAAPAPSSWPAAGVAEAAAPFAPFPAGPEQPVEAVAPLGEVAVEEVEGGRKSRTLLYAAIAALIVVAVLTFIFLNNRRKAPQQAPPAPEATAPAEAGPQALVPAVRTQPGDSSSLEFEPSAQNTAAEMDLKAIVDEKLAAKEKELQRQLEQRQRELEKQVAAAKAAAQPPPAAAQAAPPEPSPFQTPPAAKPAEPEPATPPPAASDPPPQQREPDPPPPEPARPREPEPQPEPTPSVRVGALVEPGPGVTPPQLVSFPKPEYPPMARTLRVEGIVVVAVLVDENGQVQEARVAEPIRQKVGLNEAAVAAARAARYKPATKEGVRVKMWTRLRIPFKL
ncbi:MAG TPA: TonB family protein [Thermoanaerobaculia bacterium]